MHPAPQRRAPHEAALDIFKQCGGQVWLEQPQFSAKWLAYYRPVWLVQKIVRASPAARLLEVLGLLPRRFRKVAFFDADSITLTAFSYHDLLTEVSRKISLAMDVEIKLVKQPTPPQPAQVAA